MKLLLVEDEKSLFRANNFREKSLYLVWTHCCISYDYNIFQTNHSSSD